MSEEIKCHPLQRDVAWEVIAWSITKRGTEKEKGEREMREVSNKKKKKIYKILKAPLPRRNTVTITR